MNISRSIQKHIQQELKELKGFIDILPEISSNEHVVKKQIATLTSNRNKNLIQHEEQEKLRTTVVGFFGMSVGSHAALTWVMQNRPDVIKIADPDVISVSNLNRIRSGLHTVGSGKTETVKKQIEEMSPFTKIYATAQIKPDLLKKFCLSKPAVGMIVDEIDSLEGKIILRKLAKEMRIPLISATDVGSAVFLDIERYDLKRDTSFFLGRISQREIDTIDTMPPKEKRKLLFKIVGFAHNSERMLESLLEIKKTLYTWPQLGSTATMAGGILTTALTKIILGEKVETGRYVISLDELLEKDYFSKKRIEKRKKLVRSLEEMLK
ncbi:MAG: ThiF family adenylyltransferase [bacterium]|nr:ThiF family adenylyltransferase [bacterium]